MTDFHHLTRRQALVSAGTFAAGAMVPRFASAAPARDPRFLNITLRGAMDGLAVVEPAFDPDFERVRAGLILGRDGTQPGLPLTGGFVLNPRLPVLHDLFIRHQALIVHAVASPYRERSHFDGQDVLESGLAGVSPNATGWLNRALATLPAVGRAKGAISIGATVPLILKGPAPVLTWAAGGPHPAPDDARLRLLLLYRNAAPVLADSLIHGLDLDQMQGSMMGSGQPGTLAGTPAANDNFVKGMAMIAQLFSDPNGPRIGSIDLDGWDSHADEEPTGERNLGKVLAELDAGLAALRQGLGPAWAETVVTVSTEFGRTARMNGTSGTDHGTATVAFLVGGAVKGGRVVADWPGLADKALYQNRDLAPTTDLRALLKAALRDHLQIDEQALARDVFPDSAAVKPLAGLIA